MFVVSYNECCAVLIMVAGGIAGVTECLAVEAVMVVSSMVVKQVSADIHSLCLVFLSLQRFLITSAVLVVPSFMPTKLPAPEEEEVVVVVALTVWSDGALN